MVRGSPEHPQTRDVRSLARFDRDLQLAQFLESRVRDRMASDVDLVVAEG